jgi:hypothetical protein
MAQDSPLEDIIEFASVKMQANTNYSTMLAGTQAFCAELCLCQTNWLAFHYKMRGGFDTHKLHHAFVLSRKRAHLEVPKNRFVRMWEFYIFGENRVVRVIDIWPMRNSQYAFRAHRPESQLYRVRAETEPAMNLKTGVNNSGIPFALRLFSKQRKRHNEHH